MTINQFTSNNNYPSKYKKYLEKLTDNFPRSSTRIRSIYLHTERNEIFVILEDHNLAAINELRNTATKIWGAYGKEVFLVFVGEKKIDFKKFLDNGYLEVYKIK